jgi:hypothetical protein
MVGQAPLTGSFGYRQRVNVAFSPDGRTALLCGRQIVLWDVVRREVRPCSPHYTGVTNRLPAFAPLGQALLVLSEVGLDVLEPDSEPRVRFTWAGGELIWGAVLPDGGLVTVTEDDLVHLWPAAAILGTVSPTAQETQPM